MTDEMVEVSQFALNDQASVIGVAVKRASAVVGSRVEGSLAAVTSLELGAAYRPPIDAVVLGISTGSDPAASRELLNALTVDTLGAALLVDGIKSASLPALARGCKFTSVATCIAYSRA